MLYTPANKVYYLYCHVTASINLHVTKLITCIITEYWPTTACTFDKLGVGIEWVKSAGISALPVFEAKHLLYDKCQCIK